MSKKNGLIIGLIAMAVLIAASSILAPESGASGGSNAQNESTLAGFLGLLGFLSPVLGYFLLPKIVGKIKVRHLIMMLPVLIWVTALFMPAYTESETGKTIMGGQAFLDGLFASMFLLGFGSPIVIAFVFGTIAIILNLLLLGSAHFRDTFGSTKRKKLLTSLAIGLGALSIFAVFPKPTVNGLSLGSKQAASPELAAYLWICCVILSMTIYFTYTRRVLNRST